MVAGRPRRAGLGGGVPPPLAPALAQSWRTLDGFIGTGRPVREIPRQLWAVVRGFMDGFFFGGASLLLLIPLAVLIWFVMRRYRSVWWLLTAPLAAVALSVAQRYPLAKLGYACASTPG